MKFSSILFILLPFFLQAQDATQIVSIKSITQDLGTIVKGVKKDGKFEFTNTTDHDIEIDLVSTCECTEAKWTRGPIKPGDKGVINFVFDSSKKEHEDNVDIDVYFLNLNPKTGNPYSLFLQYTYHWSKS